MIRIPLRLRSGAGEVEVSALLNTGFESDVPLISLPVHVVEELGLELGEAREFDTVGSFRGLALVSRRPVEVVVEKGGRASRAEAYVVVVPGEREAIMSYLLARRLRLVVDLAEEDWWIA